MNTIDAVVDDIIKELPQEARFQIVDLNTDQLEVLELIMRKFIRYRLEKLDETVNQKLMADCIAKSSNESMTEVEAAGAQGGKGGP